MVELETGRARPAMQRLLERVRSRSADPELFAGLVQACRYAGLERPSIAAYEHARRLDPHVRTAVSHAYFAAGEYEKVIETDLEDPPLVTALAMDILGRRRDAVAHLQRYLIPGLPTLFRRIIEGTLALWEGDRAAARRACDAMIERWPLRDPCSTYYLARTLAAAEHPRAMEMIRRSIEGGFHSHSLLVRDPWLDSVRSAAGFEDVMAYAQRQVQEASAAFLAAGGDRILGAI
jgi:hypothetical protein